MLRIVCWLLLLTAYCVKGTPGSSGKKFAFSMPIRFSRHRGIPWLYISTSSTGLCSASVTIPGIGFTSNVVPSLYEHASVQLPANTFPNQGDTYIPSIIVNATCSVSVYVYARVVDDQWGASFAALPYEMLGNEYIVLSYTNSFISGYPSFLSISAFEMETSVHIETTTGDVIDVSLHPYQTYLCEQQPVLENDPHDLTGTTIEANNTVSILSGVTCAIIPGPGGTCAHIIEQLPKIPQAAEEEFTFVLTPFLDQLSGYVYRIVGVSEHNATITIDQRQPFQISKLQIFQEDVPTNEVLLIISTEPVFVIQYRKAPTGAMVIIPEVALYSKAISFPVFDGEESNVTCFITTIIKCEYVQGLTLDDSISMAEWNTLTTHDGDMCAVRGEIEVGAHRVRNDDDKEATFLVIVYCIKEGKSFAFTHIAGFYPEADDTKPPVITNCNNYTEYTTYQSGYIAVNYPEPIITDNNDVYQVIVTPERNTLFQVESTNVITYNVEDGAGNIAMCNFTVEIKVSTTSASTLATEVSSTSKHQTLLTEGCPPFAIPNDGTVQPIDDSYNFGQIVTIYCRSGFNLIGDETLVCLDTGVWLGELPTCSPQSTNSTNIPGRGLSNRVLISATTGCAAFVFIVIVVVVCFFCKRKRKSDHNVPDYTTHIDMSPKEKQKTSPGSSDGVYSIPLDNNSYQDLETSKLPPTYQGLYAEVPDHADVQS